VPAAQVANGCVREADIHREVATTSRPLRGPVPAGRADPGPPPP
jgi:hypothetical protein